MATVSFQGIKRKKGSVTIQIRTTHSTVFKQIASTGIKVPASYWSQRKQQIKTQYDEENKNAVLFDLKRFIEAKLSKIKDYTNIENGWLKQAVNEFFNPIIVKEIEEERQEKKITLFGYIEDFIRQSEHAINPRTGKPLHYRIKRDYIRTYELLKEFSKNKRRRYDFEDIDLEFYTDFTAFLQRKDFAANTIGKFIKNLKVFLNKATEEGINTNLKYKSHRFVKIQVETENIALSESELKKIEELDLSKQKGKERVRDLFLCGCWTGLRFSDLTNITPDKIQDGFINIIQAKTGDRVIIPLHPVVSKILKKYNGNLPPSISNQKTNKALKEIGKMAEIDEPITLTNIKGGKKIVETFPKYSLISTHTARRSFATNLYKAGFPAHSIMRITGHKSESSFLKYIKVSPQEHAQLLAEFWKGQFGG